MHMAAIDDLCRMPGRVPDGAVKLAVLHLRSALGMDWHEALWLVRRAGCDQVWAAVTDAPDRAFPVVTIGAQPGPAEAAWRLLAAYLEAAPVEVLAGHAVSALLGEGRLRALLRSRRRAQR